MAVRDQIFEIQNKLGVTPDGFAGPETWRAIYEKIVGVNLSTPAATHLTLDTRSANNIATLHPQVREMARELIEGAGEIGVTIQVISGTRDYNEQNELYAKGRTAPGSIVTNARGGYSNHNFGIAFDIGVFNGSKYVAESPAYKAVAAIGMRLGLEWGGNWKTIQDEPHYQLRPTWATGMPESVMLAELRKRRDSGKDVFA